MIGFDLFYNSKYYSDAYMPPLTTFYRQSEKQLGNHFYFDAFLNVQLKRLRVLLNMNMLTPAGATKTTFLYFTIRETSVT